MPKLKIKYRPRFRDIFRHIILSWLTAVAVEYALLPPALRDLSSLEGLAKMSLARILIISALLSGGLFFLSMLADIRGAENLAMAAAFAFTAVLGITAASSLPYIIACGLVFAILSLRCIAKEKPSKPRILLITAVWGGFLVAVAIPLGADFMMLSAGLCTVAVFITFLYHKFVKLPLVSDKIYILFTAVLAMLFFVFVGVWTVSRIYCFSTPSYDMGIFSQMFYNMKHSGLPMTTVERDGLLSHFAVHVSPIYYLLLPFYMLFPYSATLQLLQAAILASAIIPLWKIARHHGLSRACCMLCCLVLLLYPAYAGGTSFDIHENCFLTPLILWTLYGIDKRNLPLTVVAAALTLLVKEDAAVYVAVIALWMVAKALVGFKKKHTVKELVGGAVMLAASVVYFLLVTSYLSKMGDGVMTYRYDNFMYDGSGSLITVIKSVILNPTKALFECVDAEKLKFIALTLLPTLGLPLITKKYERYILLIPYILINLMSDYPYQHDIFFQYTFGSSAFLIYLTVVNLAELKINRKRLTALVMAAVISGVCFGGHIVPRAILYPQRVMQNHDRYSDMRDLLDTIPKDASVSATTFYTVYLSQREILYDVGYCTREHLLSSDYVVLKLTSDSEYRNYTTNGKNNGLENIQKLLLDNGYTEYKTLENVLTIYAKQN